MVVYKHARFHAAEGKARTLLGQKCYEIAARTAKGDEKVVQRVEGCIPMVSNLLDEGLTLLSLRQDKKLEVRGIDSFPIVTLMYSNDVGIFFAHIVNALLLDPVILRLYNLTSFEKPLLT